MYISQLDRSWIETPFVSHKFEIKTPKQIAQLQECCSFVFIDTEKGLDEIAEDPKPKVEVQTDTSPKAKTLAEKLKEKPSSPDPDDLRRAMAVHNQAKAVISSILEDVRMGKSIETTLAKKSVESLVSSLIDDNNALLCLTKLKSHDEYTVSHSINVSILALAFGRQLDIGLTKLEILGLGALLHDIGKMKINPEVLNKPGKLTEEEFEIMKGHVLLGVEILEQTDGFPQDAIEPVIQHHEKIGGRGYPAGLKDAQISLYGKIMSIVDVYDAMTTDRVYRKATPPHEALKWIYLGGGNDFEQEMVAQFIKTIGIYPIGSQVEINRGHVGLVMSTNPEDALKPSVLLLYDNQKQKYKPPRLINLTEKELFTNKTMWSITKVFGPLAQESLDNI